MEGGIAKRGLIFWEVLAVLAAALVGALAAWILPTRSFFWYLLLWLDGFALVLCTFLYLPLRYESCKYIVTEEYVEYQRGVCIFAQTRVLRRAILYLVVIRGPLSTLLRTRTLCICSMGARLVIPFVPVKEAEELLRELTPRQPAIQPRIFGRKEGRHE